MEAIRISVYYPGNKGLIARKRYNDLVKTTMKTFFRVLPTEWIHNWNKSTGLLVLKNGSEIQFNHLEDPDNIKSMDLGWFAIDETTDAYYTDFQMLKSRLRYSITEPRNNWKPVIKLDDVENGRLKGTEFVFKNLDEKNTFLDQLKEFGLNPKETVSREFYIPRYCGFMATNPEPGWVKKLFIDKLEPEKETPLVNPKDFSFTCSLPTDNPYNTNEYIDDLRANDPDWVKKYVEGNWTSMKGQIYTTFKESTHVKDFKLQTYWKKFRAVDYGASTDPTVCLFIAVDEDDVVYIFDEYYNTEPDSTTKDHVENILGKYPESKFKFNGSVGDSHALGLQIVTDMNRLGLKIQKLDYKKSGIKDINAGIAKVKCKLQTTFGYPKLVVHPRCKKLIEEFYEYEYKEQKDSELNPTNVPKDRKNHCMDALRYFVSTFGDVKVHTPREQRKIKKERTKKRNTPKVSKITGW